MENLILGMVEQKIEKYCKNANADNLAEVIDVFKELVNDGGLLYVPVSYGDGGYDIVTKSSRNYRLMKIVLTDKRNVLVAFTSEEEANKGSGASIMDMGAYTFFDNALAMESIDGVVVNPWSENSFLLHKDMINAILERKKNTSVIYVDRGDITEMEVDAIVNVTDETFMTSENMEIYEKGGQGLIKECEALEKSKIGECKMTKGYNLKAYYVIHSVGPRDTGNQQKDMKLLARCYKKILDLAKKKDLRSVAIPSISTVNNGLSLETASKIAAFAVKKWIAENQDYFIAVIFSCQDDETYDTYLRTFSEMQH